MKKHVHPLRASLAGNLGRGGMGKTFHDGKARPSSRALPAWSLGRGVGGGAVWMAGARDCAEKMAHILNVSVYFF